MGAVTRRYYHGGAPNLRTILPPVETGAPCMADFGPIPPGYRRDRVYVVTDLDGAAMYAAFHPSGQGFVYEVEPVGDLEPDLDFDAEGADVGSYQCLRAHVLHARHLKAAEVRAIREAIYANRHAKVKVT